MAQTVQCLASARGARSELTAEAQLHQVFVRPACGNSVAGCHDKVRTRTNRKSIVAEQPVFWLGGKPGGKKTQERRRPEAEDFEPDIRAACEECGYRLDEYVAAQGGYGGWLAHLTLNEQNYRVFWSGKDGRMVFEQAAVNGVWAEQARLELPEGDLPAFLAALKSLLHPARVKGS